MTTGVGAGAVERLRLIRAEGVGPITYRRLMERYGSAAAALAALPHLARDGGRAAAPAVPSAAAIEAELEQVAALGARVVLLGEPDYPALLALVETGPAALTVRGDPAALAGPAVAVVGARNASTNGRHMAELLAYDLARSGLVVVSGLARGIDTAAHVGALRAGRTVAVVAGGIDVAYPPENAALQARIGEAREGGGAVVAEAPFGTAPQARHFPRRNRVIAGLSLGVVVVEAAPRSGTLITARLAAEMGRELFAIPGSPLDPRCRGSNELIRGGAHLVESAADVVANLRASPSVALAPPEPEAAEMRPRERDRVRALVLERLGAAPTAVDALIRDCRVPAASVQTALLELEIGGRIERLSANRVCLIVGRSPGG